MYLYSLHIGHNQPLRRVHGHTHIVVSPVGDDCAVWVHCAVEDRVVVQSHGHCLDEDGHVREGHTLFSHLVLEH